LPTERFEFTINADFNQFPGYIADSDFLNSQEILNDKRWRWECQSKLQAKIAEMDMTEVNLTSSIDLILLFILGLPGKFYRHPYDFVISTEDGRRVYPRRYKPDFGPQDIEILILICEPQGKQKVDVSMEMVGANVTELHWEDWINSAMGCIKAMDELSCKKDEENGTDPWWKGTARKVNLNRPLVSFTRSRDEPPNLERDIEVWNGWPFFDIKFVQFEMNSRLRAAGVLDRNCERVRDTYVPDSENDHMFSDVVKKAEEDLMEMSEWPTAKWDPV